MRVLLDTNVVIWLAEEPETVRPAVRDELRAQETELLVSAVSPWEISIKWRKGKLALGEPPASWSRRALREFGAESLPIVLEHVVRVADLPDHHADPFDRLLIAQAQVEGVPIVTGDRRFAAYDVEVIAAR